MTWPASALPSLTACHWALRCLRRYLRQVAAMRKASCFFAMPGCAGAQADGASTSSTAPVPDRGVACENFKKASMPDDLPASSSARRGCAETMDCCRMALWRTMLLELQSCQAGLSC